MLRLSGSADRLEIEAERTAHLARESVRRVLAPLCALAGLDAVAARCAEADGLPEALDAARAAEWAGGLRAQSAAEARRWVEGARAAAVARTAMAAVRAGMDPRCAAEVAEGAAPFIPATWTEACAILDGALAIGRRAPDIDVALAGQRMEAARGLVGV